MTSLAVQQFSWCRPWLLRTSKPHRHTGGNTGAVWHGGSGGAAKSSSYEQLPLKMGSWPAQPIQSVFAARGLTHVLYRTSASSSAPMALKTAPCPPSQPWASALVLATSITPGWSEEPALLADSSWRSSCLNSQWPEEKATRWNRRVASKFTKAFFCERRLAGPGYFKGQERWRCRFLSSPKARA